MRNKTIHYSKLAALPPLLSVQHSLFSNSLMLPKFAFLIKMCIFALLFWGAAVWLGVLDRFDALSIALAWLISVANATIGYFLFEYAYDKDNNTFFKRIFGGHALRVAAILITVAVLIFTKSVQREEFGWTFITSYVCCMIIETLAYQRKITYEKLRQKT
jgi:hypothetical protein